MEKFNLTINQAGTAFYEKWLKDTKAGLLLYTPLLLLFYLGLGIIVYGFTLKYILISIYPLVLILVAFVGPYYYRKKYMNGLVKYVALNSKLIDIETHQWFGTSPVKKTLNLDSIDVVHENNIRFFAGKEVYALKAGSVTTVELYIVAEFFDDIEVFKATVLG